MCCARSLVDSGTWSRCSFGRTSECPLVSGLISRIAMLFLSDPILYEGVFPAAIEQKMHCCPRCVRLFCLMNSSTCSVVMELICSAI